MNENASSIRRETILRTRTIVVKVGTNVLSTDDDQLDAERITSLAGQIHSICASGRKLAKSAGDTALASLRLQGWTVDDVRRETGVHRLPQLRHT